VQPAGRPEVDAVYGIPPTVAIEQRLSRGGRKSTVGTTTEVHHFLRLLYVKLGTAALHQRRCPVRRKRPRHCRAAAARYRGQHIGLLAPLVINRKGVYTELADWARPRGYTHLRVDGEFLPTTGFPRIDRFKEHTIELPVADLLVSPRTRRCCASKLAQALEHGKGVVHVLAPLDGLAAALAWPVRPPRALAASRCSRPSGPARCAAPAMPSWTRACSRTTASTAGAPTAWARGFG
jgi:excinuclease ABC subunit A